MPQAEAGVPVRRKPAARRAEAAMAVSARGRGDAAMARTYSAEALATLVAIMGNGDAPATARVSAANAVLDRAWGKPRQDLELASSVDALAAIQRARLRVHRRDGAEPVEAVQTRIADAAGGEDE
jgi:hypothetical protein